MFKIFIDNSQLDTYEDSDVAIEYQPFIFSDTIKSPYSTDFTIPATENNLKLLNIIGYNNKTTSAIQSQYIVGMMVSDLYNLTVNIQVVSYTINKSITIFIVEKDPLKDFIDKKLGEILVDDESSIFQWDYRSNSDTNNFIMYDYGRGSLNTNYAQLHPSMSVPNLLKNIESKNGYTYGTFFPTTFDKYTITAHKKNVCPQNKKQILFGNLAENKQFLNICGGQHITNDVEGKLELNDYDKINFNRKCHVNLNIYYSYFSRKHWDYTGNFFIVLNDRRIHFYSIPTTSYTNKCCKILNVGLDIENGDTLRFEATHPEKYNGKFKIIVQMEITDYEITEDDYGTELNYISNQALLNPYTYGGDEVTEYTLSLRDGVMCVEQNYEYSNKGSAIKYGELAIYPQTSYQFFGFYTNLDREKKFKDLIYTLLWMKNKKYYYDAFDGRYMISNLKVTKLDKILSNEDVEFSTSLFGQNNYIEYANDEKQYFSMINNLWIEKEKAVKKTYLIYCGQQYINSSYEFVASLKQYTDFEYDTDNKTYKCKFNDYDGFMITEYDNNTKSLKPLYINYDILRGITQIVLESFEVNHICNWSDIDFIEYQGKLYLITECNQNQSTFNVNLKGLLINDIELANINFKPNGELTTN